MADQELGGGQRVEQRVGGRHVEVEPLADLGQRERRVRVPAEQQQHHDHPVN